MKIISLALSLLLVSTFAFAEVVNLKDGKQVTGKIISKDNESLVLEVDGAKMTYYFDEIQDIDGQSLESQKPDNLKSQVKATTNSIEENPTEKRKEIEKFIEIFGTRQLMEANFQAMTDALGKEKPEEAKKLKDRVKVDEIIERLIPLYDKQFTISELKELNVFYSSALGQKLLASIAEIMKESVEVSAKYMEEKFPEEMADK